MTQNFSIVSANLTVEALRDSGYKSTDHALSELIDNSVDADATRVEVIAVEVSPDPDRSYARDKTNEIAVIDDGKGMDATTLRRALRFGDGRDRDRQTQDIGRFGVGLPQSSISQCRRVDIWTWTNHASNALWCYLDLDEIRDNEQQDVPEPVSSAVPDRWRQISSNISHKTGTLVVWSNLDRIRWSGGIKTLQHTAEHCGRVYRKFLAVGRPTTINNLATDNELVAVNNSANDGEIACDERKLEIILTLAKNSNGQISKVGDDVVCLPNDPLFLMVPSSTPEPFASRAMFKEHNTRNFLIQFVDHERRMQKGNIRVCCTRALPEAINRKNAEKKGIIWPSSTAKAGATDWGKRAKYNLGVSIMRARRELELNTSWTNNHAPQERWWSVEVEFDPILDEIFGVVNNKQHAHIFNQGAGFDLEDHKDQNETSEQFLDRLKQEGDPRGHLSEVWTWMTYQINQMRNARESVMEGTGTPRHSGFRSAVEDTSTAIINRQKMDGDTGASISDAAEEITVEKKIEELTQSIVKHGTEKEVACEWAPRNRPGRSESSSERSGTTSQGCLFRCRVSKRRNRSPAE